MANLISKCINWEQSLDKDGYGKTWHNGKSARAHRVAYEAKYGKTKLQLDHLCRNRKCVNPDHLEPVTCVENIRRSRVAKLSLEQVAEIRKMYAMGLLKQWQLATSFGVGQDQISRIINKKRWA